MLNLKNIRISKYLVIKCLLLAVIATMYSFRVLYNSPLVTYVPIILFILMQLLENLKKTSFRNNLSIDFTVHKISHLFIICAFVLYSFILLMGTNGSYIEFGKFFLYCFLGIMVSCISIIEIKKTIRYTLVITTIYSIYIYLFKDSIISQNTGLDETLNYLNITWSSAVGLTILLTILIFKRYHFKKLVSILILILVHLIALLSYTAAGNIIFPFLSVLLLFILKNIKALHKYYKFIIIGIAIVLLSVLTNYLQENTVVSKIQNMFLSLKSGEGNNRLTLWDYYINELIKEGYYILGIGIQNSPNVIGFYPHNFILEVIGETGIIGALLFISFIVLQIKQFIFCYKSKKDDILFLIITSLLLYYSLTYFKSFSIFYAFQFFAIIGMFEAYRSNFSINGEK